MFGNELQKVLLKPREMSLQQKLLKTTTKMVEWNEQHKWNRANIQNKIQSEQIAGFCVQFHAKLDLPKYMQLLNFEANYHDYADIRKIEKKLIKKLYDESFW